MFTVILLLIKSWCANDLFYTKFALSAGRNWANICGSSGYASLVYEGHKTYCASRRTISRSANSLAVLILEDALSVQKDNASSLILKTHYPSGRTWANIAVRLVMRV